jgi:hypothetical protein
VMGVTVGFYKEMLTVGWTENQEQASSPVADEAILLPPAAGDPIPASLAQDPRVVAAVLADSSDEETFPNEELCMPKYLGEKLGHGMVATKDIHPGDVVFAEPVIWMAPDEEADWNDPQKGNQLIGDRVKALGPVFTQNYLRLPNFHREFGKFAGVFRSHYYPLRWLGRPAKMLGCRISFLNHSCGPNAALVLKTRRMRPTPEGMATPGGIRFAVVQALAPISKGEQIAIAYSHGLGNTTVRKVDCMMLFGYSCNCSVCLNQKPMMDKALARCRWLDLMFAKEENIIERPSRLFWIASKIMIGFAFCGYLGSRVILVLMKCGMLAAAHSDKARAFAFMEKAKLMAWMLDGPGGYFFPLLATWCEDVEQIPGFGISKRGLSEVGDMRSVNDDRDSNFDIMFMIDSLPYEYARVCQYRRRVDENGSAVLEIMRSDEDQQKLDAHKSVRRRQRKLKKRSKSDECVEPELDFFELYRRAVAERLAELLEKHKEEKANPNKNAEKELISEPFKQIPSQHGKEGRTRARFPDPAMVRTAYEHLSIFKRDIQTAAPKILGRRAFQRAGTQNNEQSEPVIQSVQSARPEVQHASETASPEEPEAESASVSSPGVVG